MNLRRKIEHDPQQPRLLQTVYGVGYKLVNPAAGELGSGSVDGD